jgi:ubiquinone/menaquinone biosynthesis C-methylase UbiE
MMSEEIEQEMRSYYDERAGEYDQIYVGRGPAIRQHAGQYVEDVGEISVMVAGFGRGHLIDIACGTGFWSGHYGQNCDEITFLDQSEAMLAECQVRVESIGLTDRSHFIRGDFFDTELRTRVFDCALVGFLLSHLTREREEVFFEKFDRILEPSAQAMIIDGSWSEKRQKHQRKESVQERTLDDGRKFRAYKRYFDRSDIDAILARFGFAIVSLCAGGMFIAAVGGRTDRRHPPIAIEGEADEIT